MLTADDADPIYKSSNEILALMGIEGNPFPNVPPEIVDYWADNRLLQENIKNLFLHSIMFASSNLYLFWGPRGTGKTFAARYISNEENRPAIFKDINAPFLQTQKIFTIKAPMPMRTGQLTTSVYEDISESLLKLILYDDELRKTLINISGKIENDLIRNAFQTLSRNLNMYFGGDITRIKYDANEGYKYILNRKSSVGRIRNLNEYAEILKWLMVIVNIKYERITFIIDEVENLAKSSIAERYQFNDLIKSILRQISTGLNLILVYTTDSSAEALGTLHPTVKDRINEILPFNMVTSKSDLIEYITDCINYKTRKDPFDFIEEKVIDKFSELMLENIKQLTFRQVNKELNKLIVNCYKIASKQDGFEIHNFQITYELFSLYWGLKL